jgi:hypothetical protein
MPSPINNTHKYSMVHCLLYIVHYTSYFHTKISISELTEQMSWAEHLAQMGEKRNTYRILVRKPKGKRPVGRPRRRWVDNIKMVLKER